MTEHIVRGCGTRVKGGIYSEIKVGKGGKELEHFMFCPPIRVDTTKMGITPRGVKIYPDQYGVHHIWDWVGSVHYPNVADFLEEVRRFGMSRRLSDKLDFSKLTKESRHILLHSTAWISQAEVYQAHRIGGKHLLQTWELCPKGVHTHGDKGMCAGLFWEDVVYDGEEDLPKGTRGFMREMPSFRYPAATAPLELKEVGHEVAVFASFSIARLVVVRGESSETNEAKSKAGKSGLRVDIVEA